MPQGIPPVFNAIPQAQSVADQSFAASQNYYGNAAAYATGAFNPAATSPSVLGFHPGAPYQSRQPWNYPPQGPPYGRGAGGPSQMFPAMILQTNTADKTRPLLPAEICHVLPHVLLVMGNGVVPELQNTLDFMADTGAMTNTYKLSIMLDYCKRFPEHVRAMFDSRNGNYRPIPLAGAIGDESVLPTMSTYLPVVVVLDTPYYNSMTHEPILLTFACGEDLSIRAIIGMPTLISMGPATIDLAAKLVHTPAWSCGSLQMIFRAPTSAPLPDTRQNHVPTPSSHSNAVHAACKALWVNHVQPTHEVRATSQSTSGYGALYSRLNPLLNTSKPEEGDTGVDFVADRINGLNMIGYGQHPQG